MKDFIFAALPFVLMGLALGVFFANFAKRQKEPEKNNDLAGLGIALGTAVGIAVGTALDNAGLGAGLGMLIGSCGDVFLGNANK